VTRIGALVDGVTPERGVEDAGVERIHLEIGSAVRLRYLPEERPADATVGRLPDAEAGVNRRRDAPSTTAAAQDRCVEMVRIRRVDDDP
jgi:hypothetical protein